jgi:hypothetical protein
MKRQPYGKVKRSRRSLYHKRKSGARRFIEITGSIIAVAALIVVGYAVGKPLLDFLTTQKPAVSEDDLRWNPPAQEENPDVTVPISAEQANETDPAEVDKAGKNDAPGVYIYAPTSVLSNKSSLMAYLAQAKNLGYKSVAVELKDEDGSLWYKTGYEPLMGTDAVKGGMTLGEIAAAFESAGMKPMARISTLKDKTAPALLAGVSYRFADDSYKWLDAAPDNGGKLWADPFRQATVDYLTYISGEICSAGFTLVLANTVFPQMTSYDMTILSSAIVNEGTRFSALDGVVGAVAAAVGSETPFYIEVDLSDIEGLSAGFSQTAEVLKCSLPSNAGIIGVFDRSAFGTEVSTGTDQTITLPTGAEELISAVMSQAQKALPDREILPCIRRANLTDNELAGVAKKLSDMAYDSYIIS